MEPHIQMENEVKRKAMQRLRESSPEFLLMGDKDEERLAGLAMRRFNYYSDAPWLQCRLDRFCDLRRKCLLDLQPLGKYFDNSCQLRNTNDPAGR